MVFPLVNSRCSAIPQQLDHFAERGIAAFAAPADQTPELVVAVVEQGLESGEALALEQRRVGMQKPLEDQLVLEQAASAAPAQAVHLCGGHGPHTVRLTMSSLILPIALVGLSPLGHASTQFMML